MTYDYEYTKNMVHSRHPIRSCTAIMEMDLFDLRSNNTNIIKDVLTARGIGFIIIRLDS